MNDTYERLNAQLSKTSHLNSILDLLGWDEQVNLPEGSADYRASQSAVMAEICHRESTCTTNGELIEELFSKIETLSPDQQCVVRHAKRDFDRATKLPSSFVRRKAEAESKSYHAWAKARKENSFKDFSPFLQEQLDLAKEEASLLGYSEKPYDYHIDKHDPDLNTEIISNLFDELKKDLVPLVKTVIDSPVKPDIDIFKGFPETKQEKFLREVTKHMGFDYSRGRIDIALHPFCSGNGHDTRMTTRYDADKPLDSLFSSIHETGHGLYEQGLPANNTGNALGKSIGMAVHESQSRIWENQVGRNQGFWKYWEPRYREIFQEQLQDIDSEELFLNINAVKQNPIRVDSDEVTYNLHIILRFEIEKSLFNGELQINDLPEAWLQLSEDLLGISPKDDTEGVLQDVHWSAGAFGYFPSYCLGNMLAAQLWYCALEEIKDLEDSFAKGEFSLLLQWLNKKIHIHGKRYNTLEITRKATGKDLSPESLIRYLKARYLTLYPEK